MVNKLCILIFFTLNLVNFSGISYNDLENEMKGITKFIENGVKLEYETNKSIEEEKERVIKVLKNDFEVTQDENNISFKKDFKIDFNMWTENKKTYVSATVINSNNSYSTLKIKEVLNNITNSNIENIKFFQYYKGNLNEEIDRDLFIKKISEKSDILKIENGYTGKIKLEKEIVNFGLVNYDTGLHLIIGTPIIFTTY